MFCSLGGSEMEYVQDRPLSLQVYKTAAEFKAHRLNRTEQCRLNAARSHIVRQERIFQKEFRTARLKIETRYARPLSSCQQRPGSGRPRLSSREPGTGSFSWSTSGRCSTRFVTSDPLTKGGRILPSREPGAVVTFRLPSRSGDYLSPSVMDVSANLQTADENDGHDITTTMGSNQEKEATKQDLSQADVTPRTRSAKASRTNALKNSDNVAHLVSGPVREEILLEDERQLSSAMSSELKHVSRKIALGDSSEILSEMALVPETIKATNHACCVDPPSETEGGRTISVKDDIPFYHNNIDKSTDKRKPNKRVLPSEGFQSGRPTSQASHISTAADEWPPGSMKEKDEELSTSQGQQSQQENQNEAQVASVRSSSLPGVARQSSREQGRLQSRVAQFLQKQSEFNKRFPLRKHEVTSLQFARPDLLPASHQADQILEVMTTAKAAIVAEVLDRLGLDRTAVE